MSPGGVRRPRRGLRTPPAPEPCDGAGGVRCGPAPGAGLDMRRGGTALVVLLVVASGCGPGVDLGRAEKVVRTSLEAWQGGGSPQQLTDQGIEIAEPDWQAGSRLLGFQLKDVTAQPQQGPRVVVVLNLESRAGKKVSKEVAYEVLFKEQNK